MWQIIIGEYIYPYYEYDMCAFGFKLKKLSCFIIQLIFTTIYEFHCTFWYYSWVLPYYFSLFLSLSKYLPQKVFNFTKLFSLSHTNFPVVIVFFYLFNFSFSFWRDTIQIQLVFSKPFFLPNPPPSLISNPNRFGEDY